MKPAPVPETPEQGAARAEIIRATAAILRELDPALGETGLEALAGMAPPPAGSAPSPDGGRWQDAILERELERGSTLLDLGCGRGELLARLIRKSGIQGQGVEWDAESVTDCVRLGVPVLQMDIDRGLREFPDGSFDTVLIENTLQTVHKPLDLLREMLRVGRRGIVSFPNFGNWRVRLALALTGRMPRTESLPHTWYDTPNIHLFTLTDFLDGAHSVGARVLKGVVRAGAEIRAMGPADNLLADEVLLFLGGTKSPTGAPTQPLA